MRRIEEPFDGAHSFIGAPPLDSYRSSSSASPSAFANAVSSLALVLLCIAWILFTLVGHDPWKPDEAYSFGLVLDFLDRGDWVVPMLAGEPFLEKPPLFFITASAFARTFGGLMPLHDAARLASGFYMAVALLFLALTARELHGRRHGWTAILTMLGCLGLVVRAHQLITDLALLAGISSGIFGLAVGRRAWIRGGLALGAGAAVAFLSKGLLGPGLLGLTAFALLLYPGWRQRIYVRTLSFAVVVALPGIAAWAIALYLRSTELFDTWLITNNFGRLLGLTNIGPHQPHLFYAYTILWYGMPALPLAGWAIWNARRNGPDAWTDPGIALPLTLLIVMASVFGAASDARELYLMPMLLPLALLATAGMDRLPVSAASALGRVGKVTFGASALLLWVGWIAINTGEPVVVARALNEYQPGFVAKFSAPAFCVALLATLAWLVVVWPRAATARRGITQWTAGVTLCVVLVGSLWLQFLDAGKSYRDMIRALLQSIPDGNCVASRNLGEPQRALLQYYGSLLTVRDEAEFAAPCNVLLVQGWRSSGAPAQEGKWTPVWEGARPGDHKEFYRLYVREALTAAASGAFQGNRPTITLTSGRMHAGARRARAAPGTSAATAD